VLDQLREQAIQILEAYHKAHPLKTGMSKEAFKSSLPNTLGLRAFNVLLEDLTKSNKVVQERDIIHLSGHRIALEADQKDIRHKIERAYLESGLQPPYFKELVASMGENPGRIADVLGHMLQEGILVKIKEGLYFHKEVIETLKAKLVSFLTANTQITTPQLKEVTGVTRKYMIPLIEYFDAVKVTIRVGDVRKLREG
jgi:selenocysteine-specific elongation factor